MTTTISALYEDFVTARRAVEALVAAGFLRENISIVAGDSEGRYNTYVNRYDDNDIKAEEGASIGAVVGTLIGLGVAVIPGLGPVMAGGPLGAALMAGIGAISGAATGGVVAAMVDLGVDEATAHIYEEGLRAGHAIVTVKTFDSAEAIHAEEILRRFVVTEISYS